MIFVLLTIINVASCCRVGSVPVRCTLTRAQAVIMLMTSLVVCVNMHFFWSFELVVLAEPGLPRQIYCTFAKNEIRQSVYFQEKKLYFQEKVWPALNNVVADVLPSVLVVACTATTSPAPPRLRFRLHRHDFARTTTSSLSPAPPR